MQFARSMVVITAVRRLPSTKMASRIRTTPARLEPASIDSMASSPEVATVELGCAISLSMALDQTSSSQSSAHSWLSPYFIELSIKLLIHL